jgi:hypothetical protein
MPDDDQGRRCQCALLHVVPILPNSAPCEARETRRGRPCVENLLNNSGTAVHVRSGASYFRAVLVQSAAVAHGWCSFAPRFACMTPPAH